MASEDQAHLWPDLTERHYTCNTPASAFGRHEWGAQTPIRVLVRAKPARGVLRVDAAGRLRRGRPAPTNVLVEMVYPECTYPGGETRWVRPARGLRRVLGHPDMRHPRDR